MSEFTHQCEQCGDNVPKSKAEIVGSIGVHGQERTAYCVECSGQ